MDDGKANYDAILYLRRQEAEQQRAVMHMAQFGHLAGRDLAERMKAVPQPFRADDRPPAPPQLHELPVARAAEPPAAIDLWYSLPNRQRERKG